MKINKHILWITQSALLIAMLVGWQAFSRTFGNTLITGSGVNFILIIATMTCSLKTGLSVAVISPIMAQLFGVMPPFWILVPVIAFGNILLALTWYYIGGVKPVALFRIIALTTAAFGKFGVIYMGVHLFAIGILGTTFPPVVLTAMSISQLFTAAIGGGLAFVVLPIRF
jgi:hypothetical protein